MLKGKNAGNRSYTSEHFQKREESGEWKMAREPFVKMATVLLTMLPGLVTAAV